MQRILGKISRPQNKNNLKGSTCQNPDNNSQTIKAGREYKVKKYKKLATHRRQSHMEHDRVHTMVARTIWLRHRAGKQIEQNR